MGSGRCSERVSAFQASRKCNVVASSELAQSPSPGLPASSLSSACSPPFPPHTVVALPPSALHRILSACCPLPAARVHSLRFPLHCAALNLLCGDTDVCALIGTCPRHPLAVPVPVVSGCFRLRRRDRCTSQSRLCFCAVRPGPAVFLPRPLPPSQSLSSLDSIRLFHVDLVSESIDTARSFLALS
jgi:hypothetical protein